MSAIAQRPYLIAAGGTGGHMFPAMALANELLSRGTSVLVITDIRGARFIDKQLPHRLITAGSLSGSLGTRLMGGLKLAFGLGQSLWINLRHKPRAGACFGGYPSFPPGLAMMVARIPFLLHEQNALLGKANRLLARFARQVALSFEPTEHSAAVPQSRRVLTGNPVRPDFKAEARANAGDRFRVLVLGGSQGARVFSDIVPKAVTMLDREYQDRLALTQQCRPEDLERVREAYNATGMEAELATFFDDVPTRMASADLLITRSGASTVAEILALGRPAILVPYAYAAEDHQRFNAERLEAAGAAIAIPQTEFSPEWLKEALEGLADDPVRLATMAANATAIARPDAAARLADALIGLDPRRAGA